MASPPTIAIIGAGLGGLSLLSSLKRRGIHATVYERDSSFSARSHLGGTLDLHYASGQRAMRENGLWDDFVKNARPEGEQFLILDDQGTRLFDSGEIEIPGGPPPGAPQEIGGEHSRPDIDRTILRKMLLDSCPADSIKWSHGLTSIRAVEGGRHELTFSDGSKTVADLVVGAEGARSRVRPLLSSAKVGYVGITGAEISLTPETAVALKAKERVGEGTMGALKSGKSIHTQVNGDGRIRVYVWFKAPEDAFDIPPGTDAGTVRKTLQSHYEGWAPWLLELIERCDPEAIYYRPLPVGHSWSHKPGITLLGDAAHLMTPFAGAGANMALLDGIELAGAIEKGLASGDLDQEVAAYEKETCERSGKEAKDAMDNMSFFYSDDAPASAVEMMKRVMTGGGPPE